MAWQGPILLVIFGAAIGAATVASLAAYAGVMLCKSHTSGSWGEALERRAAARRVAAADRRAAASADVEQGAAPGAIEMSSNLVTAPQSHVEEVD